MGKPCCTCTDMEPPWTWTAAAAVVSASVGCALSLKRMLGRGHVEHEDRPGIFVDEDTLAALQRLGVALQEVLGRGMFGKVFKGLYQDMVVAVKIAEVSVPRARAKAHLTEVQIAGTLRHPNVVHMHTVAAERVGPSRPGLQHAPGGSGASSDGTLRAWSSSDDAVSPGRASSGSSDAAFSYNKIFSQVHRSTLESTEEEEGGATMWGSPPRLHAFLSRPLSGRRRSGSEDSAATAHALPTILPAVLLRSHSEEATSMGKQSGGAGGQDIDSARSSGGSMLTYRCIFVMEYCNAGTLWMALQQGAYHGGGGTPRLRAILCTAVEVAEGMAYIHSRRIVHGDLSSRNVLLMRAHGAARPTAKVSDFGLSTLFRPGQVAATAAQHGALAYMPPEMLSADTLSFATDAYSFGVVLWELLTAQTPYAGLSEEQIVHQKLHTLTDLQLPDGCPQALAGLTYACMHRQHTLRPPFTAIAAGLHSLLATFWSDDQD